MNQRRSGVSSAGFSTTAVAADQRRKHLPGEIRRRRVRGDDQAGDAAGPADVSSPSGAAFRWSWCGRTAAGPRRRRSWRIARRRRPRRASPASACRPPARRSRTSSSRRASIRLATRMQDLAAPHARHRRPGRLRARARRCTAASISPRAGARRACRSARRRAESRISSSRRRRRRPFGHRRSGSARRSDTQLTWRRLTSP